jgi:acyl carrier protein
LQTTEIEQEVRNFLTERFLVGSSEALNENVPLPGSVIDSQGVIDLVAFIQQRYEIELQDEEVTVDNFASVKSIAALIERKFQAK